MSQTSIHAQTSSHERIHEPCDCIQVVMVITDPSAEHSRKQQRCHFDNMHQLWDGRLHILHNIGFTTVQTIRTRLTQQDKRGNRQANKQGLVDVDDEDQLLTRYNKNTGVLKIQLVRWGGTGLWPETISGSNTKAYEDPLANVTTLEELIELTNRRRAQEEHIHEQTQEQVREQEQTLEEIREQIREHARVQEDREQAEHIHEQADQKDSNQTSNDT